MALGSSCQLYTLRKRCDFSVQCKCVARQRPLYPPRVSFSAVTKLLSRSCFPETVIAHLQLSVWSSLSGVPRTRILAPWCHLLHSLPVRHARPDLLYTRGGTSLRHSRRQLRDAGGADAASTASATSITGQPAFPWAAAPGAATRAASPPAASAVTSSERAPTRASAQEIVD